jgi:hypothetical protein
LPGFGQVVRKVLGLIGGERGIQLIFQANAVKVGPSQFPRLDGLMGEVRTTLDWPDPVELYVSQTPMANAMAVGLDRPFVVINSGTLELLDQEEQRVLIGHELGHIMSGHSLYRTMLYLILLFGVQNWPALAGIALMPIRLALMEWYRKSELSADRAGLLASQDREPALRVFLKLAGGGRTSEMSLDAFMAQAREYTQGGGPFDAIYRVLNTVDLNHPFSTMRAAELDRWITAGHFDTIVVSGEYTHRGSESKERRFSQDLFEAAAYYQREARETAEQVFDAAKKAGEAITDVIRKKTRG